MIEMSVNIDDSDISHLRFFVNIDRYTQYFRTFDDMADYIKYRSKIQLIKSRYDRRIHILSIPIAKSNCDLSVYDEDNYTLIQMDIQKLFDLYSDLLLNADHDGCTYYNVIHITKNDFNKIFKYNNTLNFSNHDQIISNFLKHRQTIDISNENFNITDLPKIKLTIIYNPNIERSYITCNKSYSEFKCIQCDKSFSSEIMQVKCYKPR